MALLKQDGDGLLLQSGDALLLQTGAPSLIVSGPSPLGEGSALLTSQTATISGPSPIDSGQALLTSQTTIISGPSPLTQGAVHLTQTALFVSGESPLGKGLINIYHDFTGGLTGGEATSYVVEIFSQGNWVEIPASSWQATLQTGRTNYVQTVLPNAEDYDVQIELATAVKISVAVTVGGSEIKQQLAQVENPLVTTTRSAQRYTVTLSGYSEAFAEDLSPPAIYDRLLTGIRTETTTGTGRRVRCDIDFLLQPSRRVYLNETENFIADYINYYVTNQGGSSIDAYMVVGERSG